MEKHFSLPLALLALSFLSIFAGAKLATSITEPLLNTGRPERSLTSRRAAHSIVSNKLGSLSNKQLEELLQSAKNLGAGWGETASLDIDGIKVFIKKIPLTDLEQKPKNIHSTANLFNLPLFYQYGVGSAGFGAWRELAAQTMASNWVLTGECENFPLMYHWRILPGSMAKPKFENAKQELDKTVQYWDNSPAVRARMKALEKSSKFIVLFLENIPETVDAWLDKKFQEGPEATNVAIAMVERSLETTTSFMAAHGMLHFDAHFDNILTDGYRLYFADFGLALCSNFDLSAQERAFFKQHHLYDQFYTQGKLAYKTAVLVVHIAQQLSSPSHQDVIKLLQQCADGDQTVLISPEVTSLLNRYAQCALTGDTFFYQLRKVSKSTPYPAQQIATLCNYKDRS